MFLLTSLHFHITVATNVSLKSHQMLVAELRGNHSFQNKAVLIKLPPRAQGRLEHTASSQRASLY